MESNLFLYPVDEQVFEDLGAMYKLTLRSKGREIQVNSFDEEIASGIAAFFPNGKGGVYKPVRLSNRSVTKAQIWGSMALMVELGWIPINSLGRFTELIYSNYFLTGCFPVRGSTKTIQIRFDRKQDLDLLSGEVVEISNWGESHPCVTLSNGTTFEGHPQGLSLAEAVRLGVVDADLEKVEKIEMASAAIRRALKDYHSVIKELGGVACSDGNYEDYREWYEIPDLPGTWPYPDIDMFS